MRREVEASYASEEFFRGHPEVMHLPAAAAERGMHGVFILGMTCIYFVFGYDKELIENGHFYDINGHLYDAYQYRYEHRVHIHSQYVLRRSFNAIGMSLKHHSLNDTKDIIDRMNELEHVTALSKLLHVDPPEYFDYSPSFNRICIEIKRELSRTRSKYEESKLLEKLRYQFFMSTLHTENLRPGDKNVTISDYMASAYRVDTKPSAIEKAFRKPEKWEEHLFDFTRDYADNSALSGIFVQPHEVEPMCELLKLHHIPYRVENEHDLSSKFTFSLTKQSSPERESNKNRCPIVFPVQYGFFAEWLLRWVKIDILLYPEERQLADDLMRNGTYYGFSMPASFPAFQFLREMGVKFGSNPYLNVRNLNGPNDIYCVAPLEFKPLIDETLSAHAMDLAFTHTHSIMDPYAHSEQRIPTWDNCHNVSVCYFGDEAGTPDRDGYLRIFGDYTGLGDFRDDSLRKKDVIKDKMVATWAKNNRDREMVDRDLLLCHNSNKN